MFFKKETKLREEIDVLKKELSAIRRLISRSSIGNKGVKTDIRQTPMRQQTDTTKEVSAVELVNLVSDFKESLYKKFKEMTDQEFFVFSIIYSLEEQLGAVSYRNISEKAGISESAVRDYVRGLLRRGIDIVKEKANNKVVFLRISSELKSMVSLESLTQLRSPYKRATLEKPISL